VASIERAPEAFVSVAITSAATRRVWWPIAGAGPKGEASGYVFFAWRA
jgi:hypothetical protein